ncbi:MAG: circadian clock protein KaiB [Candidatus Kuenenia sp.]|nr:circadian clock protein KaiB [Candidatus Kuenenia hertensis]
MKYILKLYISGKTENSQKAVENFQKLIRDLSARECEEEIIDIVENPEAAVENRILATPTLVKISPGKERRVVGDLSVRNQVLFGLDL